MDTKLLRRMVKLLAGRGDMRYAAGFAYVCAHTGAHVDAHGAKPEQAENGEAGGMDAPAEQAGKNAAEAPAQSMEGPAPAQKKPAPEMEGPILPESPVQQERMEQDENAVMQESPQCLSDMEAVLLGKFSLLEEGDRAALLRFAEYMAHARAPAQEGPESPAASACSAGAAVADWLDAQARLYTEE